MTTDISFTSSARSETATGKVVHEATIKRVHVQYDGFAGFPGKDEVQLWITRFAIREAFRRRRAGKYALWKIIDAHRDKMGAFTDSTKRVFVQSVQNDQMAKLCISLNILPSQDFSGNFEAELEQVPRTISDAPRDL